MEDTLPQACPDYGVFVQHGKDLLFDDFITELESYFEALVNQGSSVASEAAQDSFPIIESKAYERLPVPRFVKDVLTTMEELKLDGKHFCGGTAGIAKQIDQVRTNAKNLTDTLRYVPLVGR